MCYAGGNCDGGCEHKWLHQHNCPVCDEDVDCVGVDCDDEDALCDQHTGWERCGHCGTWVVQTDRVTGYCPPCQDTDDDPHAMTWDEAHPRRPEGA
jgi:hypothetical protein